MLKLTCMMDCEDREKPARLWANLPYFLIIVLLLAAGCAGNGYQAPPPPPSNNKNQADQEKPKISQSRAQRELKRLLAPIGVEVTNTGFSFIKGGNRKYVKFSELQEDMYITDQENKFWLSINRGDFPDSALFWLSDKDNARYCAAIIYVLKYYSAHADTAEKTAELAAFKEKAKTWRALPVKPALPAEANRFRVLAEDAFQNKDFNKAIDYYDKALEAYPLWPQGQFNAALICGEIGSYAEAAGHMQRYLELVPDAKDAKLAREKIYIWEEKAK